MHEAADGDPEGRHDAGEPAAVDALGDDVEDRRPGTTISASAAAVKTRRVDASGRGSDAGDVRHQAAVVGEVRVPALEALLELAEVVPALREPQRLRRVGRDAVLVPGDLPGDGHDHLAADAGERDDRGLRRAEALRDAGDRAAVRARVEEVGGLDDGELGLRETAQDRLVRDGRLLGSTASAEKAVPSGSCGGAASGGRRRQRRAPLAQPAVLERDLGAERADVDVLAAVRVRSGSQCSPMRSERSQIAQVRVTAARVTRMGRP